MLAADAGSNQISVLRVNCDGGLSPAAGSPVSSGGIEPVSIAVHDGLVYVANEGDGISGSNYTGFRLSWTRPAHADLRLDHPASRDRQPRRHPVQRHGQEPDRDRGRHDRPEHVPDRQLRGGAVRLLHPAFGSPFAAQAAGPFGSEFSPTGRTTCTSRTPTAVRGTDRSPPSPSAHAKLKLDRRSPFADGQTAPCWVEISHDGRYLFAVNTGSTTISSYQILANGSLQYLTSTAFSSGTGIRPFDARLD